MPGITIDGRAVDVPESVTVMEAAAGIGIEIPALCHMNRVRPLASCMICIVEDTATGKMFPSCSAPVQDRMVIETDNDAIRAARREILQLLLSEHVGDCEAPCRRICPAGLDVPRMMRLVAAGDCDAAARLAKESLVIPGTLGWVCSATCERGCHRGAYDEPLMIREVHRRLAEDAPAPGPLDVPKEVPTSGKRVAIVGAGVAGLAAAFVLLQRGHACRIFERSERPGGPLRDLSEEELPRAIFDAEVESILRLGAELETGREIGEDDLHGRLVEDFDAVVVACDDLDGEGDAVFEAVEFPLTVSAVAEGKETAERVDRFLRGVPASKEPKPFDCRLGPLGEEDRPPFLVGRADPASVPRRRVAEDLETEAGRCLDCDCRKPVTCKLRQYATEYGAKQYTYPHADRGPVEALQRCGGVLYEPGKCIKCGLCVEIAKQEGEALGLTFVGRGFDVRVGVPFNRTLEEGLAISARRCAQACPTGALAFQGKEER